MFKSKVVDKAERRLVPDSIRNSVGTQSFIFTSSFLLTKSHQLAAATCCIHFLLQFKI